MSTLSRRQLLESAGLGLATVGAPSLTHAAPATAKSKPVVYWTPEVFGAALMRMYQLINKNITGKVALKLHTGEPNGPLFCRASGSKIFKPPSPTAPLLKAMCSTRARARRPKATARCWNKTAGHSLGSIFWTKMATLRCPSKADCT